MEEKKAEIMRQAGNEDSRDISESKVEKDLKSLNMLPPAKKCY